MLSCGKKTFFLGIMGIIFLAASPARADRTLTEYEAKKLTFSELVAPPSHYYHRTKAIGKKRVTRLAKTRRNARVQSVTYRKHAVTKNRRRVYVRKVAYHGHAVSKHRRHG